MSNSLFSWVHLSDLHFQTGNSGENGFNSTELRRRLPDYLKSMITERKVDALILTGDYRYAPKKGSDHLEVTNYIKELAEAISITTEQVYLVPGNHDLTRSSVRSDTIRGLRDEYTPEVGTIDSDRLKLLRDGFDYFVDLRNEIYQNNPIMRNTGNTENNPHRLLTLERCNLLLLNTALTSGRENNNHEADDENNLLLGMKYIEDLMLGACSQKPTIAIGHHGMEFLRNDERKACATFFENHNIHLYLCGHTHQLWGESFGSRGKEYSVGCLTQNNRVVDAAFIVGELDKEGSVHINSHKWDSGKQKWYFDPPHNESYKDLYDLGKETILSSDKTHLPDNESKAKDISNSVDYPFTLKGYVLLGSRGIDGIRYIWERNGHLVESVAFNERLKGSTDSTETDISAYTCSVSYGCRLHTTNQQCVFCETGKIPYGGDIYAEDIALQSIFMAEYDSDCPSYPQVRNNRREFAFMGQGEPGLCYPAIRRSIQLTDIAMNIIGQKVYRYIISTCGIHGFVDSLIDDINQGIFQNRVSLHFSLHAIDDDRSLLMPINKECDYISFIKDCEKLFAVTQDKIGIGILMFHNYLIKSEENMNSISMTIPRLERILRVLDKDIFRIDLCDVNSPIGCERSVLSNEMASNLLNYVTSNGFEGKLFSSFDESISGCGMLSSSCDNLSLPGNTTMLHFHKAVELLNVAVATLDGRSI